MVLFYLLHNFVLFFGISYLGSIILKRLDLEDKKENFIISFHFSFITGFVLVSLIIYLITLNNFHIINSAYLINFILVVLFLLFLINNLKNLIVIYKFLISDRIILFIFGILLLFSLLPVSDADSIAYHFDIPKKIIDSNALTFIGLHYHEIFYGPGEAFYLLGAVLNNYSLAQFINLIALVFIFHLFCIKINDKSYINSNLILYSLISIPVLFQLVSTGKPQLIFISIIFYYFVVIFNKKTQKKGIGKNNLNFLFLMLLSFLVIILSKITFVISCFILSIYFFFSNNYVFRSVNFYSILIFLLFLTFLIFFQKYQIYEEYSLYFIPNDFINFKISFINFLDNIRSSNNYAEFPINLFIPTSKVSLLDNLGYVSMIIFILFYFSKKYILEKFLFLFFIILLISFGLKHSRFYIELLLFASYILIYDNNLLAKYNNSFFLKIILIPQILYIILFISYLAYLDTKIFSSHQTENYKNNNVFGYTINNFLNSKISNKSKILIDYRALFYSNHEIYYLENLKFGDSEKNTINILKNIRPDYIVNIGEQNILKSCRGKKIYEEFLIVNASRNPLKKIDSNIKINVYEFQLDKCKDI